MGDADEKLGELQRHIGTLEEINEGLRQSFEELSALYRLSETIASALTFSRVMSLLMEVTREVVDYDAASLYLFDERTQSLRLNMEKGMTPELRLRTEIQMRDGTPLWALRQGRAVVVPDSGEGAWIQGVAADDERKSFLLVPILARGKPVGLMLLIAFAESGAFSQRDLSLLSILANQAGISLENARLYEAVRQDYVEVIQALAGAVDARDHYTREHSNRVSTYAVLIARQMKQDEAFIEAVQFGGLLHDIGKIGVPDQILNKPARLTKEEFDVMKSHATLGGSLVRKVESLAPLVPLVLYHHERFDGAGYPEGLAGKKIPLGARILNIADSYETMTSDRVYHKARSLQEGYEEVLACSGGQFDPEVVKAFIDCYDQIKAIALRQRAAEEPS